MCASAHQICIWRDCFSCFVLVVVVAVVVLLLLLLFVIVVGGVLLLFFAFFLFCYLRVCISTRSVTCKLSARMSKQLISIEQKYSYNTFF